MEEGCAAREPGEREKPADVPEPLGVLLRRAIDALRTAGIQDPARDARLLVAHALGLAPDGLTRLRPDTLVGTEQADLLVARRVGREPLAFITGARGFWTLDLAVSPATLVPRPDTETVVEAALAAAAGRAPRSVLDLGTGTGAILLALLAEWPVATGLGIDRSEAACRLARRNAVGNRLAGRAAFLCGDWDAALGEGVRFDMIVSNPPYVPSGEIATLMPEVSRHEPPLALDGGSDGLDCYRRLLPSVARLLTSTGAAVFEIGVGQGAAFAALTVAAGLLVAAERRDLASHVRAITVSRP